MLYWFFHDFQVENFFLDDPIPLNGTMKRSICKFARVALMMLDSQKFGLKGLKQVLVVVGVDSLIIGYGVSPSLLEEVKKSYTVLRIAVP